MIGAIYSKLFEYGTTECLKIVNGTIKHIIDVANASQIQKKQLHNTNLFFSCYWWMQNVYQKLFLKFDAIHSEFPSVLRKEKLIPLKLTVADMW